MIVSFGTLDPPRLAASLVAAGLIRDRDAARALEASLSTATGIERTLLEFGLIEEEALFRAVAGHLGLPFVGADALEPGLATALGFTPDFLQRVEAVPVCEDATGTVTIATADPAGAQTLTGMAFHIRRTVQAAITTPSVIRQATAPANRVAHADSVGVADADLDRLRALANDGPVIKMVNDLIAEAVTARASDIHIEAEDHGARVRFRVDGVLVAHRTIPESARAAVVSRLKVMAQVNISEKRRPQDGRADVSVRGRTVDIRVSTLPTQFGESIVLRLLDRNRLRLDWADLGFSAPRVADIRRILAQPNGIFLVAGPTGSGKTTTLYTALDQLNSQDRKIVTVEDPIEYSIKGVAQVQVEPGIDMTFGRALRAILRQDPDVIMVGEIRDEETADIAVRAALVGRMVLSTIHTNDALAAVDRLCDLGVPPYLLAATLRGVLSQRLVRRLCTDCTGAGCAACGDTGRKGRVVISELLAVTPALAASIGRGEGAAALASATVLGGFVPLWSDGAEAVRQGLVAEADMLRALGSVVI